MAYPQVYILPEEAEVFMWHQGAWLPAANFNPESDEDGGKWLQLSLGQGSPEEVRRLWVTAWKAVRNGSLVTFWDASEKNIRAGFLHVTRVLDDGHDPIPWWLRSDTIPDERPLWAKRLDDSEF